MGNFKVFIFIFLISTTCAAAKKQNAGSEDHKPPLFFGLRVNVGALYSSAKQAEFKGVLNGLSFTETDHGESQFGVSAHLAWIKPAELGTDIGITYEFARDFTHATGNINGTPYNINYAPKPTLQLLTIEASANYTLKMGAYIKGGINYPYVTYKSSLGTKIDGSLGYQFGLGYLFKDNFIFEGQHRFLNAKGSYNDGTLAGTINEITFNGFLLMAKYSFY